MFRNNSLLSFLMRSLFAPAMPLYAFDPNDPADVAALDAAVDKATAALKAKNAELVAEVRAAKRKGGDDHSAELERVEAERDKLQQDLADASKAAKLAQKAADDATKALQSEQAATSRLLVDNGLLAALGEAGVKDPIQVKAAMAILKTSGAKFDIKADGDLRTAMVGDKPLADHVKGWAAGDEGKHFVAAPGNTGGGAAGGAPGAGGAPNPWAKDSFNLTQQGKILTENPAQAAALQAAAGVAVTK